MKRFKWIGAVLALALLSGCTAAPAVQTQAPTQPAAVENQTDTVQILLDNAGITVDGRAVSRDMESRVYVDNDIVYYESGRDFTYGEGTQADAHTPQEAGAHTVLHITKPGTYNLSGQLSKGQVAVDLGENAEDDPSAVVTLILSGVDITCEVAPAVIFYDVYECADTKNPTKDVETAAAGANVILADGTVNTVRGSYVARIYEPDSVELNEDKTQVEEAKKLHKYDGAFYSKMSMNINGGQEGTGILNIVAENEGLDSEMHLTINGGVISILSGNDGVNTNEDGVSVTTINGGELSVFVAGQTGEGDGIDSNGWLVINGGKVFAYACANSADVGIDSDMGIHINGGMVLATGHMLDRIEEGGQTYSVFNFAQKQTGKEALVLKDEAGKELFNHRAENAFSVLVYSSPDLVPGSYTLWAEETQLAAGTGGFGGGFGKGEGGKDHPPQPGEEGPFQEHPQGENPFGDRTPPEGTPPAMPGAAGTEAQKPEFIMAEGANMFSGIAPLTE